MSSYDRAGQSDEEWKRRQDARAEENERQFHIKFEKDQAGRTDSYKTLAENIEELVKTLNGLNGRAEDLRPLTGMVQKHDPHQDAPMGAEHPQITDLLVPSLIVTGYVLQGLNKALEAHRDQIHSVSEQSIDGIRALGASIAETWDQFKLDTEQVIEDVKQQMTELVSPERAPAGQQEKSTELGGEHVDKDTAEIRKLHDEQEKQRAELDKRVTEQKDQLTKQYEGPEQEKHLEALKEAAKNAATDLARRQEAEMQRLLEQQMQRLQEQQVQSRDR
jgi:hypothetical protein